MRSETMKRYVGEIYEASLRQYAKHNILLGCVLDAGCEIGPCNRRMQEILDAAKNMGKLETA